MYLPEAFKLDDLETLEEVMRRFSFATLVSERDGEIEASHLPLIYDRSKHALSGHFAKANPHWRHFEESGKALAIFHGPHAYVSPAMYATEPNVPTWAYVTVHVRGVIRLLTDDEAVEQIISMVDAFDPDLVGASKEPEYVLSKVRGVKAFELKIEKLEGKFKVDQNKLDQDRLAAGAELVKSSDPQICAIGRMYLQGPAVLTQAEP